MFQIEQALAVWNLRAIFSGPYVRHPADKVLKSPLSMDVWKFIQVLPPLSAIQLKELRKKNLSGPGYTFEIDSLYRMEKTQPKVHSLALSTAIWTISFSFLVTATRLDNSYSGLPFGAIIFPRFVYCIRPGIAHYCFPVEQMHSF